MLRRLAICVPAVLLVAGAGYYFARPKPDPLLERIAARLAREETVVDPFARFLSSPRDREADANDADLIRRSLARTRLNEPQSDALIAAAGRRYMRRKLAYADAQSAPEASRAKPEVMELMSEEVELARKVCDIAEFIGRRARYPEGIGDAAWDLELRMAMAPASAAGLVDRFNGSGTFTEDDLKALDKAFRARFNRALPVSAHGSTALHRALGFDHTGRTDVAVRPDQPEGRWVRDYLMARDVPFFAFRGARRGIATGAHIHIGPASVRRVSGD